MSKQKTPTRVLDYRQADAANSFLPNPSILKSSGWNNLHLEVYQQPKFEITEHRLTMHVIAQGLSGGSIGERWLDGKGSHETRQNGDLAIIPAEITHCCNWDAEAEYLILAIEPRLLHQIGQDWVNCDRIELKPQFMNAQDALIQAILLTLRTEISSGGLASQLLVDSLSTTLAIHLLRNYCVTQPRLSSYADGLPQSTLKRVTDFIHAHLDRDLELVNLSAIAQISPYHFLRLFKKSMGTTPHQYILQCRVKKAKYLLKYSELSITEIASRVGFCDQSHLNRYFKQIVGLTPKQFLQS
jgi:AraC family transcriptional regulator